MNIPKHSHVVIAIIIAITISIATIFVLTGNTVINISNENKIPYFNLVQNSSTNQYSIQWYSTILYCQNGTIIIISPHSHDQSHYTNTINNTLQLKFTNILTSGHTTTYIPQTSDKSIFSNQYTPDHIQYPENATFDYPSPTSKITYLNNKPILLEVFIPKPNHTNTVITITDDTQITCLTLINRTPFGGIPVQGKIILYHYPNETVQIITPDTPLYDQGIINFLNSSHFNNTQYLLSLGNTISYIPDTYDGSIFTEGGRTLEVHSGIDEDYINNDSGKRIFTNNGNIILTEIKIIDPNNSTELE